MNANFIGLKQLLRKPFKRLSASLNPFALILLYHRVSSDESDPLLLRVKPENFSSHMEILRRYYQPQTLSNLRTRILSRRIERRMVVVTFDDGYADNLYYARPILEHNDVPGTVFVTSGLPAKNFWWDSIQSLVLCSGKLPPALDLPDFAFHWEFRGSPAYSTADAEAHKSWNVLDSADPTERHTLYRKLSKIMMQLDPENRYVLLQKLEHWSGKKLFHEPSRALSESEVKKLGDGGLVEIGAHSENHPVLSALTVKKQEEEIKSSKTKLEEITGYEISSFAYPYGTAQDYTPETVQLVREAGFECACSNFPQKVRHGTSLYELPRILVRDCPAEEFEQQLRNAYLI